MTSVFADLYEDAWPHRFETTLLVRNLAGGIPSDPKVAEGWLKTKIADKDDLIREMVAETMVERGVTADEAITFVQGIKNFTGFKRDEQGLYIEGRQVKAAIKEAAMVALASGKLKSGNVWGKTNKGLKSFVAEHVMVVEDRVHLGVTEPSGIVQSFVHKYTGSSISYTEYVEETKIGFSVISDWPFTREEWGHIWLKGQEQGLGTKRSQGFGRYDVVQWDEIS